MIEQAGEETIKELRAQSIAINRTFADLGPLLVNTKFLALNAEIAAAHMGNEGLTFGIVAKEVIEMGTQLAEIVGELESVFKAMAAGVARWITADKRVAIYQRTLDRLESVKRAEGEDAENEEADKATTAEPVAIPSAESSEHILRSYVDRLQTESGGELNNLRVQGKSITGALDRLNIIATRKSNYLAISSNVEASLIFGDASGLKTVAENLAKLAKRFSALEKEAADRVFSLNKLLTDVVNLRH